MKQDMNGVRTAQDLEIKYDLANLSQDKETVKKNTQEITKLNEELKQFTESVTKDLGELHDQVDGNIMTWFQSGVPTLDNYPANEWITGEEKNNHLGDLYYDKETGYAYRFTLENDVYNWLKLTDSDISKALAVANAAQDTADSKRRVFLEQPTPPYDNGDMWIKDKEIWICQISKAEGESFAEKDFINELKYTDDTVANQVGENLTILSGTVLEIKNDVDEYSRTLTETQKIVNEQGEEIGTLNTKYSSVEQSVNSLEQQVSEIQTFINYVEGNGSVTLENTSNTSLYKLSIKGDISLLFGNDGKQYGQPQFFREDLYFSEDLLFTEGVPLAEPLYPSSNLFGKNMNLIIEYKEDDKEVYKLPFTYLNYLSQEVSDEFILEDNKAKIIRRVGINSSMQKYELPNEVLEELGDFTIPLKEGNPKIYLQCFDSAIYNATYMIKNAYTKEFATKVELNSSITQTKNEINLEVSKKVDENEVIASINLTSEEAKINASKITLEGIVTANQNFKVLLDGSIEAKNGTFSGDITSNNAIITGGNLTIGSKFKVTNDGTLTATNGNFNGTITSSNATITGGSLTVGNKFKVTSDGTLTATGGTFNGNITASSGKIGTWTINSVGMVSQDGSGKWTGIRLPDGESKAYSFFTGATANTGANASFVAYSDGSLYANNASIKGSITSSSISGSTITGGSIKIEGTGFFTFGTGTTHPWASAINVTGLYGVNFYTGTNASSVGSQQGYIDMGGSNGALQMVSLYTDVVVGGYHVKLSAREGNIYASRGNGTNYLVATSGGNISSLNLKENIKIFDNNEYEKAYKLLQNIDIYRYDYKYKISDNKKEYGFIIDYIEKNNEYDDFLYFYNQKANVENNELDYLIEEGDNNVIEFKKYDSENLLKYLFTIIKVMQIKIDKLEGMTENEK